MIVDCKAIREDILSNVRNEIKKLGIKPRLTIITCSDDKASEVYVRNKIKTCQSVGIEVNHINLDPEENTTESVIQTILSHENTTDGFIVQLPLANHIDEDMIMAHIDYRKDVDGLTYIQQQLLKNNNNEALIPCTAKAVDYIIKEVLGTYDLSYINVTIVNRSKLIGMPLFQLLLNENATPTVCHSKTGSYRDILNHFKNADIVITGIGKPEHFDSYVFEDETLVIDCGISYVNGKLKRDVKYREDKHIHYAGAVGVITTACVCENVLQAYKLQN